MTDRIKGLIVTFERDIREDDAEDIIHAISMIRGVLAVDASVTDYNDHMNREKVRRELLDQIFEVLKLGLGAGAGAGS